MITKREEQGLKMEMVLLVDDEREMLDSLKRRFDMEGIETCLCSNADEALAKMRENNFNVVMTDIKMPGSNGVELLRNIKELNPLCNVIIMTAYSNMTYLLDCFSAGACDYFAKPFVDLDLLVKCVKDAINRVSRWKKGMGFEDFPGTP